jgi:hypothetical protein
METTEQASDDLSDGQIDELRKQYRDFLKTLHPLNGEDVTVTITFTHTPTGRTASASLHCPADESPDMDEAIPYVSGKAADELLASLEQAGGG